MAADPPFETTPPFELSDISAFLCSRGGLPDICQVLMPGGLTISAPNVLSIMQPALAPLAPLFAIMQAVVQIKVCMEAAVDALAELDPGPLIDCVPGLTRLVDKLLSMLPSASLPKMAVDVLDCALSLLLRTRAALVALQAQAARVVGMVAKAAELQDEYLQALALCKEGQVADSLSDEMKGLVVLGQLLGVVAELLKLAGLDINMPDFEEIAGSSLEDAIEPIDDLVQKLQDIRETIPLPE